ncbi:MULTISPECIES: hypothetical protein [Rhodobacterales]|jgi:hypothetical protein|uniref:hypothetical protein n=1 Tax=Rhodobacterales TaxID=204455 RepID=UPI00237F6F05|nr:hypothetical protein [Phaeobacter gallaeciensis]MDE4096525.1 hypothetical protein [Phaeobacter gallaeciensis]MDE4105336.1 hypothetical protein [Phaeobacter gallaeciensis]MDE4109792.1 hypothetical protein [Phaeobacter gallaeciensis]MDE4114260.1 hypothetical protein [Phaeobacter gallaeciensis]MDE4118727.1 hypothetical protein [Phaeobacter gallaeciensis]
MKHFLVGMAACIVVALSPLLVLASNKNLSPGTPILVVSAPWGPDAPDVIAGSGLQEISPERAPFGALTVLEDLADARRLKENGAWFVVDGTVIAQICAE